MIEPAELTRSIEDDQQNDVIAQLKGIRKAIDDQKEPSEATYLINQDGPTHVRMRVKNLLLSVDNVGATAITLVIGAKRFIYNVVGPLTLVVPPPVTIVDRGIDVAATASAGNVDLAQFRYAAE